MTISKSSFPSVKIVAQRGAALLISVVVLLALTIIALASTNSNQLQTLMVRNAQFRMETFNASYSEIDAQIDIINDRSFALIESENGPLGDTGENLGGVDTPEYFLSLLNQNTVSSDGSTLFELPIFTAEDGSDIEQVVTQEFVTKTALLGYDLTEGSRPFNNSLRISSDSHISDLKGTKSNQDQIYNYVTLEQ